MKGAIFDVDGTLLDSMGVWVKTTEEFFAEHNVCVTSEEVQAYQSMTLEDSLPLIQAQYLPHMTFDEMMNDLRARVHTAYQKHIPEKLGASEYVKQLHNNGIKIAIATSGFPELCKSAFIRLGISDCIDAYAFSSEVGCDKSKPDIYLLAAERIGLPPDECTVYEDLLKGIESAKSAGFKTVAIADSTNASLTKRLIQHSDRYITGWDELLSNI